MLGTGKSQGQIEFEIRIVEVSHQLHAGQMGDAIGTRRFGGNAGGQEVHAEQILVIRDDTQRGEGRFQAGIEDVFVVVCHGRSTMGRVMSISGKVRVIRAATSAATAGAMVTPGWRTRLPSIRAR